MQGLPDTQNPGWLANRGFFVANEKPPGAQPLMVEHIWTGV
jgi:hypothetical protein